MKTIRTHTRTRVSLALTLALSLPPFLVAQTPASSETDPEGPIYTLSEFTVTGEKTLRPLEDTTGSVGLVGSDRLEESVVGDLTDTFRLIANVRDADFLDSGFLIRGINSEGVGGPAGSPLASVYIDGVAQTANGVRRGARGTWDLQQVEVWRGPQSTLSGRNSLAGSIRLVSKDPTFFWEGAAMAGFGNLGQYEGALMVSGPISDSLAFRFTAEQMHMDGEIDYPLYDGFARLEEREDDDYQQFRGKLLYEPDGAEGLRAVLTMSASYDSPTYDDVDGPSAGVDYEDRVWGYQAAPVFVEARSTDNYFGSLQIDLPLAAEEWSLASISGVVNTVTDRSSVDLSSRGEIDELEFSQELRATYQGESWEHVFGLYLLQSDFDDNRFQNRPWETDERQDLREGEVENFALFGESRWRFAETWTLIGGLRYDYESQSFDNVSQRVDRATGALVSRTANETEAAFDAFLPKAGITYDLTEDTVLGFTVQRAYRAGGAALNSVSGTEYEYEPEYAWNYELSLKGRALDGRLYYGANLFYMEWTDQQINVPQIPGDFTSDIIVNAGESTVMGGELELDFRYNRNLRAFASIGVAQTEFQDFTFLQFGSPLSLDGESFPQAPELTAVFGIDYNFDNGFFLGGDTKYTDSVESRSVLEGGPADTLPSYWIANFRGGWRGEQWSVIASVENAFDEQYFRYRFDTPGFQLATMGRSRTYGLQVKYEF